MSGLKEMNDRELVERLLKNDQKAWEYVLLTIVMRIARQRKYSEMVARARYEPEDVVGEVYADLAGEDFAKLRTFEFRGSFDGWLRTVVLSAVQRILRKNNRESLDDPNDPTSPVGSAEQSISTVDIHLRIMDKRAAFARFWNEDSESAFIVLMRNELGLSADDVGELLGRLPNTIVQKARRAQARLRELEAE
jgi:DNA-directed RNA polymerase specialized sigma24 family protein